MPSTVTISLSRKPSQEEDPSSPPGLYDRQSADAVEVQGVFDEDVILVLYSYASSHLLRCITGSIKFCESFNGQWMG
jgi:hypothetical protein